MGNSLTIKDLAKRGLECEHSIGRMLSDIWKDFEAIEPTLAKRFAESFGSAEFAALMIIGRFKGQPSILEELSTNPLSEDDIKNFLERPFQPGAQPKESISESLHGEMTDSEPDDETSLFEQAERARGKYEQDLVGIFRKLKKVDSEVASLAMEVWDDEVDTSLYLASPVPVLAGKSPLEALKNGDRDEVISILYRIEYGIYS